MAIPSLLFPRTKNLHCISTAHPIRSSPQPLNSFDIIWNPLQVLPARDSHHQNVHCVLTALLTMESKEERISKMHKVWLVLISLFCLSKELFFAEFRVQLEC